MNRLTIIGNLTSDPEVRVTQGGKSVCNFTVAVNRKRKVEGQPDADFFRVTAWNALAETCGKWLIKGKKVAVEGPVSLEQYETQNGKHGATIKVFATEVEFLSPGVQKGEPEKEEPKVDEQSGMTKAEDEDLPF